MKLPTWHGEGTREKAWQGALSGYGARLMAGMGWREGQGLGKDAQGIARCLEEKRKATPAGVGAPRDDFNAGDAWWERAFDSAARRMNAGGSPQPSSSSSSGSSSSSSSDSSDTATGGAATKVGGAAAAARHRDGMVSTMTAEEMALAERLAKASGRAPAGRFGGREGKLARVRRQEQALAGRADEALGARLAGALNPAATEGAGQGKRKREPAAAAAAPAKRVVREVRLAEEPERAPYRPTFGDGWWGLKRFAFGGLLEGRAEKTRTFENGFRAEDQERLYRQAHFKKTVGKGGLGAGALGLPAKNLGNAWKGSKTTFGGGAAGEGAADGEEPPEKKEKKKKDEKKKEKGKKRAGKKKAKKATKATAPGPAGSRGSAGGLEEAAVVRACRGLWEKKGKGGKVDLAVVVKALRKQFSLDKATAAAEVAAVLKASKRFKVKGAAGKERVKLRGGRGEG